MHMAHLMGDHVLTEFAEFIKSKVRSFDMVYRFGGEEFVLSFQERRMWTYSYALRK